MSSHIDLDFQDYTPTHGGGGDTGANQHQPDVQILIPSQGSPTGSTSSKAKQNTGSVFNVIHNVASFGAGQNSPSGGGLSEEALQQLIWLSNKQRSTNKQRGSKIAGGNWGLNLLAQYFDVTTSDVIQRIVWSAIPIRKEGFDLDGLQESDLTQPLTSNLFDGSPMTASDPNESHPFEARQRRLSYMERFIQSRPDFYGPFWVSTTLIFSLAIFSNIVSSIKFHSKMEQINRIQDNLLHMNGTVASMAASVLDQRDVWHYDMSELNTAASLITFYVTLLPSFFWFLFWLRGCAKYYTLTETICAYGYSLSIFIPMSALLIVQASAFRYLVISLAAALSGSVLVLSFLPMVHGDPNSSGSHIILVIVFACQFGLAYILHRIMLQ